MSKIVVVVEEMRKAKSDYRERGKIVIDDLFKEIFNNHPEIVALTWRQYTPYFNDGDACIFRVGDLYTVLPQHENDDKHDYEYGSGLWELKEDNPLIYADVKPLSKFMGENSDLMQDIFGDHVKITAHPDGNFDSEEYKHD